MDASGAAAGLAWRGRPRRPFQRADQRNDREQEPDTLDRRDPDGWDRRRVGHVEIQDLGKKLG